MDDNKILGIGAKLTSGIQYIFYDGHDSNDIFIKAAPGYKIKLIAIIVSIVGLLLACIKFFF